MFRRTVTVGRSWIAVAAMLPLAACAGGFSDDRSVTQISTDPAGARCTLQGAGFTQIVETPAKVVLPKEAAPVTVSCAGEGYRTFVTSLKPMFNAQVFGNLLTGSVIAMVVDFTNGHSLKYPAHVRINMEPAVFSTVEARDRWFSRYRAHVIEKWSGVAGSIANNCSGPDSDSSHCQEKMRAAEADRIRELALLEERRRQVRVEHSDTAEDTGSGPE